MGANHGRRKPGDWWEMVVPPQTFSNICWSCCCYRASVSRYQYLLCVGPGVRPSRQHCTSALASDIVVLTCGLYPASIKKQCILGEYHRIRVCSLSHVPALLEKVLSNGQVLVRSGQMNGVAHSAAEGFPDSSFLSLLTRAPSPPFKNALVKILNDGNVPIPSVIIHGGNCASLGSIRVKPLDNGQLRDERVDPAAHDNYAIRFASRKGHFEIVRLLLQDKRVDPSAKNHEAIFWSTLLSCSNRSTTLM